MISCVVRVERRVWCGEAWCGGVSRRKRVVCGVCCDEVREDGVVWRDVIISDTFETFIYSHTIRWLKKQN